MKRYALGLLLILMSGISGQVATLTPEQFGGYSARIGRLLSAYEQELGIFKDPFLTAFDQEEANAVYNRLMRRSEGFFCNNSPLFRMQHELKSPTVTTFNQQLVEDIINDAETLLNGGAQMHDLQSDLLALQTMQDYLNRFAPLSYPDQDKSAQHDDEQKHAEKKEKQNQEKNKHQGKQQGQQQQSKQQGQKQQNSDEDQEEEYPEFGDDYKPHTKDTGSDADNGATTKSKTIIAEVNFKTRYFGVNVFSQLVRNNPKPLQKSMRLKEYYASLMQVKAADQQKTMIVRPLGRQQVKLFMPPGYQPALVQLDHARVELDGKGSFELIMDMPLERVAIPLVSVPHHGLTKLQEDIFSEHVGFDDPNEWPDPIQCAIMHKYKQGDDVATIAKALEQHLSTGYLYSRDARTETDPIDVLKSGAFQCDLAAFIMASVLRDVYNIPCRIVVGFRAKMRKDGATQKSYLVNSNEGHAWVEVFHDGKWNVYDPTPTKKDKQDENEGEKSEFTDVPPEDQQSEDQQQNQDERNQQKQQNQQDQQSDQQKASGKEQTDNGAQKAKDAETHDKKMTDEQQQDKKTDDKVDESKDKIDVLPELEDSLAQLLEKPLDDENLLRKEVFKLLLIEALNPLKPSNEAGTRLAMLKGLFDKFDAKKLMVIKDALEQHKFTHPSLLEWSKELYYNLEDRAINATHRDLVRMHRILDYYKSVIDSESIRQLVTEIMQEIHRALSLLHPLKDKAANDMALLDDVKKNSPALLWQTLQKMYGLDSIGSNIPTQDLAKALREHKHDDHLLLSNLYPHTDFIMNSSVTSGSMLVKTWLRDGQKRGRDLLQTQRIEDWRYAIPTDHQHDLIENINRGTAFVMTKRKKVIIPMPNDNKESKRITIVGFDVSGSMAGEKAEFQAALLAAFVCRALEDVSPSGAHRHQVVLVPFGSDVYPPKYVKSSQEALDLIKNHQDIFGNKGDGTDIQKFLMQAMTMISQAQDKKNPFEIANIILMSDGGSSVDYDELAKARKAINRDTPLQMMFAAIGETNEDLKKFAIDSKKMGAKEGFYKEFLNDEIAKTINDSKNIDMKKYDKYFYTSAETNQLSPDVATHLLTITKKIELLVGFILNRMTSANVKWSSNVALFARNHPREQYTNTRYLEKWLTEIRQLMANNTYKTVFQDDHIVNFIINNIVDNLQKITGVAPTDLTHYENEEMIHWLQDPRAVENSKGKP